MNKSLIKAIRQLHAKGITEDEHMHIQYFNARLGDWYDCEIKEALDFYDDCLYRVKPITVSIEIDIDDACELLNEYNLSEDVSKAIQEAIQKVCPEAFK